MNPSGVQMKSMASEAIYRKALKLTSTAKGTTSTGQLVNIMSTDTNMVWRPIPFGYLVANVPIVHPCPDLRSSACMSLTPPLNY